MNEKQATQPTNYEIMRDRMELEFAKYDQEEILRKFPLRYDADFFYLRFFGRDYRINRSAGRVEWFCPKEQRYHHADFNESMVIFDMLAWSKPDCRLSGQFMPADALKGTLKSASPAAGVFAHMADPFTGKTEALKKVCQTLGGTPGKVGDVSCTLPLFDFFPVVLQFWDADEEFDAVLKFMWDANAMDFMHYETICYAIGHMVSRLKALIAEEALLVTEVVAALIWQEDRFLICQRPAHKARGLLWEFVGGKVEPGETKEEALIRECREELGVELTVGPVFLDVLHPYPDLTIHLTVFHAAIAQGEPQLLEHRELRWITPHQIPDYAFCPADMEILAKFQAKK